MGRRSTVLGTRQVLAYLAGARFFSGKEEISRTREERKGEEASSSVRVFPAHGLY